MSDDVDIYDDLPVLNLGESISQIEEHRQQLKEEVEEKDNDLKSAKEKIALLEKENRTLEENISSLYKTAVNEINRKDRVIEELRREKDTILFRRKQRHTDNNGYTPDVCTDISGNLHSKDNQDFNLPCKEKEQSVQPIKSVAVCIPQAKKSSEQTLESKDHYDSTLGKALPQILNESLNRNINTDFSNVQEDSVSVQKLNEASVSSPNISDNSHLKIDDASSDKLSSSSSHTTHHDSDRRNWLNERFSHRKNFSKEKREKSSLNSQDRREERHKQNSSYSQHHFSSRSRSSSHRRYRSPKVHSERRREDRTWNHSGHRNYRRESYKESDDRVQFSVGNRDGYRDKRMLHSERSPSPKRQRKHNSSPSQKYSSKSSYSSLVNRYTKPQSDNMRIASQVKSKYSRAMREKSLLRSPVKQKADKPAIQNSKVSYTSPASTRKLSSGGTEVHNKEIYEENMGKDDTVNDCSAQRLHINYVTDIAGIDSLVYQEPGINNSRCKYLKADYSSISVNSNVNEGQSGKTHFAEPSCETNCLLPNRVCMGIISDSKQSKKSEMLTKTVDEPRRMTSDSNLKLHSTITETLYHCSGIGSINKGENGKLCSVDYDSGIPKSRSSSEIKKHIQIDNQCKSFLKNPGDSITSNVEGNQFKEEFSSAKHLSTPPSNHTFPLNVSPSFEDSSLVIGNKFSFSVSNEQCEFKRHRRKRSVKLMVIDSKNVDASKKKGTECDRSCDGTDIQTASTSIKKNESFDITSNISTLHSGSDCNSMMTGELQSIKLKEGTIDSAQSNETVFDDSVGAGTCEEQIHRGVSEDSVTLNEGTNRWNVPHCSVNLSYNSKVKIGMQSRGSTGNKRKVDSISEELKANLKKKKFVKDSTEVQSNDNCENLPLHCDKTDTSIHRSSEFQKISNIEASVENVNEFRNTIDQSTEVDQPIKRTVVSRLRRRVHNLQDSVVQVLSQVKSKISP